VTTRIALTDETTCALINVICGHENNPEKYCMNTNDPVFCKGVGDLCDADGFVKPEYPYCTYPLIIKLIKQLN
jgi:hypothetical protein